MGEGDSVGCFVLLFAPPYGYCLKASMTATPHHPVISHIGGNDGVTHPLNCRPSPVRYLAVCIYSYKGVWLGCILDDQNAGSPIGG